MKQIKFLTGCITAGTILLVLGLAGTARAIPILIPEDLDASSRRQEQGDGAAARSLGQGSRHQRLASSIELSVSGIVLPGNADRMRNLGSRNSRHHGRGASNKPLRAGQDPSPASVPDGGATALLMGGAFWGLALLGKRLKA